MRRILVPASAMLVGVGAACTFPWPPDVAPEADARLPIDAPVDARPDLVTGRSLATYVTDTQSTDVPFDLSVFTVQALVPSSDAPGGFVTRTGIGRADGTFEIEGVPPGISFILKLNRSYYVTDQHQITLRSFNTYRGDATVPAVPTPVTVAISDMPPTAQGDTISLLSVLAHGGSGPLPAMSGQTQLVASFEWTTGLPDAVRGDDLVVHQRSVTPPALDAPRVERIVAAGNLIPATLIEGQANDFNVALTVPPSLVVTATLQRAAYAAGHSPLANNVGLSALCAAVPAAAATWGADGGLGFGFPSIVAVVGVDVMAWASSSMSISGEYPDPFPAAWPRFCSQSYGHLRPLRLPGTSTAGDLWGGSQRIVPPGPALQSAPLAPPTAIRVAGQDGEVGGLIRNDGSPLEISWSGVSQATQYGVAIYQLRVSGDRTAVRLAASITTQETRLVVPAEALAGSDFLSFVVAALSVTNDYEAGALSPSGLPGASARAVTAMFRWSATCGNGQLDLGEDCDGAGPVCDADCTAVECGDGTRNAAAGELCDSVEDTIGCDDDCTANTCGDGHVNANTEQCDDGGTAAGDGCSPTCRTE